MFPRFPRYITILLLVATVLLALLSGRVLAQRGISPTLEPALVSVVRRDEALANGLKLVYGETVPNEGETTLWLANPTDLSRVKVATIRHLPGYPPRGSLSPDGAQIALLVIPPGASEQTARTRGGDLWIVRSDGSGLIRAASQVNSLGPWSPDSRWIAFERLVLVSEPADAHVPYRTEIYRVSSEGTGMSLLLTDDQAYGIQMLGWTGDAARFLAARIAISGAWSVQSQDVSSGAAVRSQSLPDLGLVRGLSLSPDGSQLIVESSANGRDSLRLLSLSGGVQAQSSSTELASGPIDESAPVSPVTALWSRKGNSIWLHHAARADAPAQAMLLSAQGSLITTQVEPALPLSPVETLLPISLSPDDQWRLWQLYPRIYTDVYLQAAGQAKLARIPQAAPDHWITFYGWIPD